MQTEYDYKQLIHEYEMLGDIILNVGRSFITTDIFAYRHYIFCILANRVEFITGKRAGVLTIAFLKETLK